MFIHIAWTQDAIYCRYIEWQEQLRPVASVVREAVMFLSGACPDCLYNSSLLIYQLPSPPRRQEPLQPAGQAKPPRRLSNVYRYPWHGHWTYLWDQQWGGIQRREWKLYICSYPLIFLRRPRVNTVLSLVK